MEPIWEENEKERLARYEKILKDSPLLYSSARKTFEEIPKDLKKPEADACAFVLAPALVSYVAWILKESTESKKRRLYFLARDGYFMYKTARVLCEEFGFPIECRYLSCSRYSVRIPTYCLDFEEALDYICRGGIDVNMEKILDRAGLKENEKAQVLKDLKEKQNLSFEKEEEIPHARLGEIKKALGNCGIFKSFVMGNSQRALPLFLEYLRQEGLFENIPMALADSGWVGSMQKILGRAIEYGRGQKDLLTPAAEDQSSAAQEDFHSQFLEGYYWGLYELPLNVEPGRYHCYYFQPDGNIQEKIFFSNCLFEAVFSAPHGMTMGYEKTEGRAEPVYAAISPGQKKFMEETGKIYKSFTENLAAEIKSCLKDRGSVSEISDESSKGSSPEKFFSLFDMEKDKEIIFELLSVFMGKPSKGEAEAFGSLHFSDDVIDHTFQELAPVFTYEELKGSRAMPKILSLLGIKKTPAKDSAWYEASAVRNGKNIKRSLKGYERYKKLLYMKKELEWRKIYG